MLAGSVLVMPASSLVWVFMAQYPYPPPLDGELLPELAELTFAVTVTEEEVAARPPRPR